MMIELLFVLFTGLIFGSFITCASYRLPRDLDVVKKPSYCPSCNTKLTFKDLWPVASWMMNKGKCRHCDAPVSVRYPLIELITTAVFLLLYARYGLSLQGMLLALFAVALLVMIVVDFEHYIIPDQVHLFLLPLGVAYQFFTHGLMQGVVLSFAAGAALGLGLHHGYRILRKQEGLGFGDVKFFAVAGVWLGGLLLWPPFLFLSGTLGIVIGLGWRFLGRGPRFPFGPALALALFLCVVYPEIPHLFWNLFSVR